MPKGTTQLDADINEALRRLSQNASGTPFDMAGYIAAFRGSAIEKARTVLTLLNEGSPFAGSRPAFLSIGGGDGEELRHLLKESNAGLGVLIEGAPALAERARDQRNTLAGKRFEVVEGDAHQRLREALEVVRKEVAKGRADFVAVTCHAVIHELFDRGQEQFDPLGFFGAIFDEPEAATWFTYREPGEPEKWPPDVLVQADCSPKSLLRLAEEITRRHPSIGLLRPRPSVVGDHVRLHRTAAMELLAKLFYLRDLGHEIEERATAVDHARMMNSLWLAIGEEAESRQWARIHSGSEATRSFIDHWDSNRVRVLGLDERERQSRLSIAESHTRVIAWRLSPRFQGNNPRLAPASAPREVSPDPALSLATQAHTAHNRELVASLLVSHGRWWIESPDKDAATQLLQTVRAASPPDSLANLWSDYLLSIARLFKEPGEVPADAFSAEKENAAEHVGLGEVFRAERMECARKRGDFRTALELANDLRRRIGADEAPRPRSGSRGMWAAIAALFRGRHRAPPRLETGKAQVSEGLARYVRGTSKYLLANLLRSGGRYDLAHDWITRAEGSFQGGIPSHDTELAHCHYARQVCTAVMGRSEFDPPRDEAELLSRRFSGALIVLSYSHAAWFLGDIDRALQHAERAAAAFKAVGADRYVRRAEQLQRLLQIWKAIGSDAAPSFHGLDDRLAEALRCLAGLRAEWEGLSDWLADQRPSTAVGLLQFARRAPGVWQAARSLQLPFTIEVLRDGAWRWSDPLQVRSLEEADSTLRTLLSIPSDRRVPLIAD